MTQARLRRQDAIRTLVRTQKVRTQAALIDLLSRAGYEATQATISRDIAELGLGKDANGNYILPEDHKLHTIISTVAHETRRAYNQVLILSDPGTAPSVAAALDAAKLHGVLGCIAGDDTVLVICSDEEQGQQFQASMDSLLKG